MEAKELEKDRITAIKQGNGASKTAREFGRERFNAAADQFLDERKPHVADRTYVRERNLLSPFRKFFGERVILRIKADDIGVYQRERRGAGIKGRMLNMEIGVLRRMMKRGKTWSGVAEDVTARSPDRSRRS